MSNAIAAIPKHLCDIHSVGANTRERLFGVRNVPQLEAFGIRLAGISEAAFGFSWCRVQPVSVQLLACFEGEGEVWVDERWASLMPGEAYLSPVDAPHAYRAKQGVPWTVGWVTYDPERLTFAGVLPEKPQIIPLFANQLRYALEGACDAVVQQVAQAQLEIWLQLIHSIVLQTLKVGHPRSPRLGPLWNAVNAELARPWTLDLFMQNAAMSKENLRRVCLKETGVSPMHYLLRLRVRRAIELLLVSNDKLVSIAERVGYTDPFAFSTAFKRETGLCPSEYRKIHGAHPQAGTSHL